MAAAAVLVFAVGWHLNARGAGIVDDDLRILWQMLDVRDLADSPISSVWNLHIQPPLYNLYVGLMGWAGVPIGWAVFGLFMVSLWAMIVLLTDLLRRWRVQPWAALVFVSIGVCGPSLLWTVGIASYEIPSAALMVFAIWAFQLHMERSSGASLLLLAVALTAGGLTRSLLSPFWIVAVFGIAVVARPVGTSATLRAFLVPLLLIGGVIVKNEVLFDTPTTTSWFGFNLQRGAIGPMDRDVVEARVETGDLSSIPLTQTFLPFRSYADSQGTSCLESSSTPALDRIRKETVGVVASLNYNHQCYLEIYDQAQSDALTLIGSEFEEYMGSRQYGLALTFASFSVGYEEPIVHATGMSQPSKTVFDYIYPPLMLNQTVEVDTSDWTLSPFEGESYEFQFSWTLLLLSGWLLWAALSGASKIAAVGMSRKALWEPKDVTQVVIGLTFCAIVLSGVLFELGENGRFRAMLDPVIISMPLAWLYSKTTVRFP